MRLNLGGSRNLWLGKTGGKGRTLVWRAVDQKPATMTINDVFDQRQPKPGAALCAAVADIHSIEPLGQSRQMFVRDAGAGIPHDDGHFRHAPPWYVRRRRH